MSEIVSNSLSQITNKQSFNKVVSSPNFQKEQLVKEPYLQIKFT